MEWFNLLTAQGSKDTIHINDVNTLYSLWVAKYNENDLKNLQNLKETRESSVKFQSKLEKKLFVAVSVNSYKNGPLIIDV